MQWPISRWIVMMLRPSWKAPSQLVEPLSAWSSPLNPSRNHRRATSSWLNATAAAATPAVATTSISVQCHRSLLSLVVCHSTQPPLLTITTTFSRTSTPAMQVCPIHPVLWLQCRCFPRLLISISGLTNPIDRLQPQPRPQNRYS